MKKFLVMVVVALGLTGCFKKVGFDTTLVIYPKVQEVSGAEFLVAEGVTAYAYYVSGEDWKVLTYEDAVAKVITNTKSGETKSEPAVESESYASAPEGGNDGEVGSEGDGEVAASAVTANSQNTDALGRLTLKTKKQHVMLVAVYPTAEMWAYRHYEVGENLPVTTMKFHFRPWKTAEYVDSGWTCNKKPVVETPEEGEGGAEGESGENK